MCIHTYILKRLIRQLQSFVANHVLLHDSITLQLIQHNESQGETPSL
jgi:hypothetical protein